MWRFYFEVVDNVPIDNRSGQSIIPRVVRSLFAIDPIACYFEAILTAILSQKYPKWDSKGMNNRQAEDRGTIWS